jgi:hypothetical protein
MEMDTAGDPISGLRWTRRTTGKIADELRSSGIRVSPETVARLLKEMGYSLRVNHKKISNGSSADRDEQFTQIAKLRRRFIRNGNPIISVDTKKKELVGRFKNPGVAWRHEPIEVNDHDFRSDAIGIAIPYGIYDLRANQGMVFIGTSYDTSEFAVDCIHKWWINEGRTLYPNSRKLAILADAGGSNSATRRAWKLNLQDKLCNRDGLVITVAHYPSGASKWNPIEHRLFSEISKNWSGMPLDSYETILKYARTTRTSTGLRVRAQLVSKRYAKGIYIDDAQMQEISIQRHEPLPKWNYTICPN